MIIHSTILDTESKVINQYGGTTWIQHTGYFLRGASSGVSANNNTFNTANGFGGSDNAIVVAHQHGPDAGTQYVVAGSNTGLTVGNGGSTVYVGASGAGLTKSTGSSGTDKNIPRYKSVYIWERTA